MWLFRNLAGNLKSRLVQKFVENDHLKVDRLMELHIKYHNKIQDCDAKIETEKQVGLWVLSCKQQVLLSLTMFYWSPVIESPGNIPGPQSHF